MCSPTATTASSAKQARASAVPRSYSSDWQSEAPVDHLQRTVLEFTQQAENFAASAATTDRQQVLRLVESVGAADKCSVLDLACGPGIVTAELAAVARDVVAFDLTPAMLARARERCEKAG